MFKDVKNAALICKNNFCGFYGFTYATRAQFAAGWLTKKILLTFPSNVWLIIYLIYTDNSTGKS